VKKTQCHICSFDEGHFVCSQAPVIENLNKALADLATERDRFGKREIELMRELEKYKSIAQKLAEAVKRGMAALAYQADPIETATIMGELLAKYHQLTTPDSNKGKE
jgi:hypothetical protein